MRPMREPVLLLTLRNPQFYWGWMGSFDLALRLHAYSLWVSLKSGHITVLDSNPNLNICSGLGMTPSAIGTALSVQGLWSVVCQLTFLSKMQRKYGTVLAFQRLNAGWVSVRWRHCVRVVVLTKIIFQVLVFLTLPLVRVVAVFSEGQHAGENGESRSWLMWIALMAWLALSTFIGKNP
jgi:hypothetical protein